MQVGCHVSASGSIDKAVDNAVERNCTAFQIFTRSPRSWHAKELTKEVIDAFKSKLKDSKIDRFAICAHMPYLPNLATPKEDAFEKSVNTLISEVERCAQLGIPYLVTIIFAARMLPMSLLGILIGTISERISPVSVIKYIYALSKICTGIAVLLVFIDKFNIISTY